MTGLNNLYPHLLQPDIDLWLRYLDKHADKYNAFDYDVRIGKGRDPGNSFDENMRRMGVHLSQRRIDVVGYKDNETLFSYSIYGILRDISFIFRILCVIYWLNPKFAVFSNNSVLNQYSRNIWY